MSGPPGMSPQPLPGQPAGAQPGWAPTPWRPPPPRPVTQRHPILFGTIFALSGLTIALVILLVAVQVVQPRLVAPPPGPVSSQPVSSQPASPPSTQPPLSTEPPPSTKPPTTRPPSSKPPSSKPPTKPTDAEAAAWRKLRTSPVHQVTLPEHVACLAARTDAVALGDAAFAAWIKGLIDDCLVQLWAPTLAATGIALPAPRLVVVKGDSVDSPCGVATVDEAAAFECNEGIYVFRTSLQDGWGSLGPWAMVFALSHEFGHYVQYRAGMFDDDVVLYNGKGRNTMNAISRRIELQATCLGTMVLGAIAWQIPQWDPSVGTVEFGGATDEIHGTHANQQYWGARGYASRDSRQCNTWAATTHLA